MPDTNENRQNVPQKRINVGKNGLIKTNILGYIITN